MYRYIRCDCGKSDGNDDQIISRKIVDTAYNGEETIILEERQCDICLNKYRVLMHYKLNYEEIDY